jgi:SWI/SNF-related matrix-associated actin-dependent regulator 1 of chromatin subfamily A
LDGRVGKEALATLLQIFTDKNMMKIIVEKSQYHRFALYYDYNQERVDFCKDLKDSFGWKSFSFDSSAGLKRWIFSESLFVPVIKERFPETEIDPEIQKIVAHEQQWVAEAKKKETQLSEIKAKTDTNFTIKGLKKTLYPYQKVGVEFLTVSGGRAIVADAPGLGKTAQALAYIKHTDCQRTLDVATASVKFSWKLESEKWTRMSCEVIDSKTDLAKIKPETRIWIINYDILKKHYEQLSKIRFDCMIGDECQLIKSTKALRTKAFRAISRHIPSIILLSGTPLLSRPAELFSLLNIVDPTTWDNFYDFARRYCDAHQTRWGLDTSGVSNPEELHARIKGYFIRRNKTEVLKELPPKTFIDVPVKLDPDTAKRYALAASDLAIFLRQYAGKQPAQIAKTLSAEKLTKKNVLRLINALGKIDIAIELIESVIDAGEKVLVFSSFIEPLDKLKEHFKDKAVMITGSTNVKDREEVVRVFQNDPSVPVFLGGIRSAGVGITLTAASNVIFLDFPWNPADYIQACDRVHRPGQIAKSVNIYQLFAMGTVDEDLRTMLEEKQQIFDQVIEGKLIEKSTSDVMEAIERRILNEY